MEILNNSLGKGKKNLKELCKNFFEKCKNISSCLEQNKININSDDSLADKTFFAFLADILRAFKQEGSKQNELLNELRKNENLTREKLEKMLSAELEKNESLSREQKEQISKFINTEYGKEFSTELVGRKFKDINDLRMHAEEVGLTKQDITDRLQDSKFDFSPKDIQAMTANSQLKIVKEAMDNELKDQVKEVVKKVVMKQ